MVNAKFVAFTVNKQTPFLQTPDQAYATVINCRPSGGKRLALGQGQEAQSHHVPLTKVEGSLKRKRGEEGKKESERASSLATSSRTVATALPITTLARPLLSQQWQQRKPTKLRRGKILSKGVDLDCWFIILSFSDPALLLEMRTKIASCYRFLRDNPKLWKHSREYYYGDMPDPPSCVTEFQFAHLRHGHGCMSCGTPKSRKTYWAFLRRMCKTCLTQLVVKDYEALQLLKGPNGEDASFLRSALPSGIFDSWGNFVGVGPASTHALKTIYFRSDVEKLSAEYIRECQARAADVSDSESAPGWIPAWLAAKVKMVEERQDFAKKMEQWEEMQRTSRTSNYSGKKSRRKVFFQEKASQLDPPISTTELEACPAYKRAIGIPKEPNNLSWDQLKPKVIKEAAENAANNANKLRAGDFGRHPPIASTSGFSTPTGSIEDHPYLSMVLGRPPSSGYFSH